MGYGTDAFLEMLYNRSQQIKTLINCSEDELETVSNNKREKLKKVLKIEHYEEFNFLPKFNKISTCTLEDNTLEQYDVEVLPNLIFPMYMLTPNQKNNKTILYCHGHGPGCKDTLDRTKEDAYHKCIPLHMASKGYTVVVYELIGFGEVIMNSFKQEEQRGCIANCTNLLMYDLNMAGLRVYQAMKLLDIMTDVLGLKDIAVYGVSGGGLVCAYTCALDTRPKAAVISSYGNLFKYSIMPMHHCIDNYPQGILNVGESPEIISLSAPKALLLSNGDKDRIFPLQGTNEAIAQIQNIYNRFGIGDKFKAEVFDGIHEVSLDYVFEFLKQML